MRISDWSSDVCSSDLPARAARELLWLAAAVTVAIPLTHGLATGMWPWTSAVAGHWAPFWVDAVALAMAFAFARLARASTRRAREGEPNSVRSEEHTSELQSLMRISYDVFCLKKKKKLHI